MRCMSWARRLLSAPLSQTSPDSITPLPQYLRRRLRLNWKMPTFACMSMLRMALPGCRRLLCFEGKDAVEALFVAVPV